MSISFYSSSSSGSTLNEGAGVTTIEHSKEKDFRYIDKSLNIPPVGERNADYTENILKTMYGYGTVPKTAEELESIVNSYNAFEDGSGKNNPNVADHIHKEYDTTIGNADIYGTTPSPINARSTHDLNQMLDIIRRELYIPTDGYKKQLNDISTRYNRFKLPNVDLEIKKCLAHVFFCRPLCHLIDRKTNDLYSVPKSIGSYNDIFLQNRKLVEEICDDQVPHKSDFMYILSNYCKSFALNDEELHHDTYGKTYTGYKISYGKTNIESKTAGNFSVTYNDDRTLSVYKIHRLWTDYINDVYRGKIDPDLNNIVNKVLDYVGAVYYILTAEDNESILFWSKYYGVYPISIPSNQYSWNSGSTVNPEQITIQYNYSWKEDFNPAAIVEFNTNAKINLNGIRFEPMFDKNLYHVGSPLVGTPYIERVEGDNNFTDKFIYKLRFIPDEFM